MNKTIFLSLSGIFMMAAGITMLISENIGVVTSKILVPLFSFSSGICAFLFSRTNKQHKVANNFHFLQGMGMMIFAVVIAILPQSLDGFLKIATYFILAYGLFEIMFAFSVLRSNHKLDKSILMARLLVGLINFIGAFVLFMALLKGPKQGLTVAGILIILGGLGFLLFSSRISGHDEINH